ncbi:MAG: hypothetical protein WEA04_03185 [Candidatus Andersenbacteria bacterium]
MKQSLPMRRLPFFLAIGAALVLLLIGIIFPDLPLYLRTQVAPTVPTVTTHQFAWTPPADTELGEHTLTIVAGDDKGNQTSKDIIINVTAPSGALKVSRVKVAPTATVGDLTFDVSEEATTKVDYDVLRSFARARTKETPQAAISHAYTLDQLVSCTNYRYKIQGQGSSGQIQDGVRTFVTAGCPGDAAFKGGTTRDISSARGGVVNRPDRVTLAIPGGFHTTDANFQILQLERDTALAAIGKPANREPISGLYEVKALVDATTSITSFNQPITVTMAYEPSVTTNEATITIYRWDGSTWQPLSDCVANTAAKTVTCTTTQFSTFGAFGQGGGTQDPEGGGDDEQETSSGDSSGGSDSGGDGGGDSSSDEASAAPVRTLNFQVEQGHTILGSYSGIQKSGSQTVVKLAHPGAVLERQVTAPRDNYWLDVHVRHDRPGPIHMAVYLNNRAWKVIKFDQNDNKYRTHRIGLLRNFAGARIRFRLLNDTYDKANPANEELDRNLFIDWYRLTTGSSPAVAPPPSSRPQTASRRSAGWNILPQLNSYITQELGAAHVTFDIWQYYARRLTAPTNSPEAIQSETQLRNVMQYWKGVRPARPRGD